MVLPSIAMTRIALPEAERYLTSKGMERTREAARGLRHMDMSLDHALASPYVRAMQTAEIFCTALGLPESRIKKTDALKPEAPPRLLFEELAKSKAQEVICFGHGPNVDELDCFCHSFAEGVYGDEEGGRRVP